MTVSMAVSMPVRVIVCVPMRMVVMSMIGVWVRVVCVSHMIARCSVAG